MYVLINKIKIYRLSIGMEA